MVFTEHGAVMAANVLSSKVAVAARQEKVDPVGSCVGIRGVRIQNIVNELMGEKIDVIEWSSDTTTFIANALSPAKPISVGLNDEEKVARVIVPNDQMSLAIGKDGQNARLAYKLTGWRIDVKDPDSIRGEEGGLLEGSGEGADYLWIIDPLDGTTNFIHGVPHFAISIACKYKGRLEHAVVLDPVRQEEFTASRGRGAALNGRRLRVSNRKSLEGALLGTGFPFRDGQMDNLDAYLGMFRSLVGQTAGIRRAGAASLDLAYVAALDDFWSYLRLELHVIFKTPLVMLRGLGR